MDYLRMIAMVVAALIIVVSGISSYKFGAAKADNNDTRRRWHVRALRIMVVTGVFALVIAAWRASATIDRSALPYLIVFGVWMVIGVAMYFSGKSKALTPGQSSRR